MLWRVCRGNVFLRQTEIVNPLEDPVTVSIDCLQTEWVAIQTVKVIYRNPTKCPFYISWLKLMIVVSEWI